METDSNTVIPDFSDLSLQFGAAAGTVLSRRHRQILFAVLLSSVLLLSSCHSCTEFGREVGGEMNCVKVFDDQFVACYGPIWDTPRTNSCGLIDRYELSLQKPMLSYDTNGATQVVRKIVVPYNEIKLSNWLIFAKKIVYEDTSGRRVCFHATTPATCFSIDEE